MHEVDALPHQNGHQIIGEMRSRRQLVDLDGRRPLADDVFEPEPQQEIPLGPRGGLLGKPDDGLVGELFQTLGLFADHRVMEILQVAHLPVNALHFRL